MQAIGHIKADIHEPGHTRTTKNNLANTLAKKLVNFNTFSKCKLIYSKVLISAFESIAKFNQFQYKNVQFEKSYEKQFNIKKVN